MSAPRQGPIHPRRKNDVIVTGGAIANSTAGNVEPTYINDSAFYEQYHTFMKHGYARDTSNKFVGNVNKAKANEGSFCFLITFSYSFFLSFFI